MESINVEAGIAELDTIYKEKSIEYERRQIQTSGYPTPPVDFSIGRIEMRRILEAMRTPNKEICKFCHTDTCDGNCMRNIYKSNKNENTGKTEQTLAEKLKYQYTWIPTGLETHMASWIEKHYAPIIEKARNEGYCEGCDKKIEIWGNENKFMQNLIDEGKRLAWSEVKEMLKDKT